MQIYEIRYVDYKLSQKFKIDCPGAARGPALHFINANIFIPLPTLRIPGGFKPVTVRWVSGLNQRFAKPSYGLNRTESSNLSLTAINFYFSGPIAIGMAAGRNPEFVL